MFELLGVLVSFDAEEHGAKKKGQPEPTLGQPSLVLLCRFKRQNDRNAGANQDKRVEGTNPLDEIHLLGCRPCSFGHTKPENDIGSDQTGEKHDFGGQK